MGEGLEMREKKIRRFYVYDRRCDDGRLEKKNMDGKDFRGRMFFSRDARDMIKIKKRWA